MRRCSSGSRARTSCSIPSSRSARRPCSFAGPKRLVPLPIDIPELPRIDVVLISHNHYDHLDAASVMRLAAMEQGSPRFLVPLGLKAWFATLGITRVDEYDWWQERAKAIFESPSCRCSTGASAGSRRQPDAVGRLGGRGRRARLIHTGDTGYSQDFRDIGERLGPFDMAFIPIGGYAPRWFMKVMHVDVPEAVQVRADLKAAARDRHALGHVRVRSPTSRWTSRRGAREAASGARARACRVRRDEDRRDAAPGKGDAALSDRGFSASAGRASRPRAARRGCLRARVRPRCDVDRLGSR